MVRARLRAAAAGTTTIASTSSAPITLRLTTIAAVSSMTKRYSRNADGHAAHARQRRVEAVEQEAL